MPPIKAKENEIGSFGFGDLRFWKKDVTFGRFGSFFCFFLSVSGRCGGVECAAIFFGKVFFC